MSMFFGGILTANEIRTQVRNGIIQIDNFDEANLGPNSYNVRIGSIVKKIVPNRTMTYEEMRDICPFRDNDTNDAVKIVIDPRLPIKTISHEIGKDGMLLFPNQHYLIPAKEKIGSQVFIPKFAGRSTSGRMGISTFQSANFGDIGFSGVWTLQVSVMEPTIIYPNSALVQVYFLTPYGEIDLTYNGKYQNSDDAIGPRYDQTIAK